MFIVSGELSGDIYASYLISSIKEKYPQVEFFGIGGENSRKAGCRVIFDSTKWGVVGATEILKILPHLFYVLHKIPSILAEEKPDFAILIDYPGFNLKLAQILHKNKIKVVYYIPPMVFWRKGKKAQKVARLCDKVITIFPQEYQEYLKAGANVYFIGHPLLDVVHTDGEKEKKKSLLGVDEKKRVVGIFPGSRVQEIENLFPVMLDAAKILKDKISDLQFVVASASKICRERIENIMDEKKIKIDVFDNLSYEIMSVSDIIFVASGTATLEATILCVPMIIMYKVSFITEFLANFVLAKKIIGLPNIVAQRLVVPELLQKDVDAVKIADIAYEMLESKTKRTEIINELNRIKEKLGEKGAIKKAAEIILS